MKRERLLKLAMVMLLLFVVLTTVFFIINKNNKIKATEQHDKEVHEKEEKNASKNIVVGIKGDERTIVRQGEEYIEAGAFGIEKGVGPISEYKTKGKVDTDKPGDYTVTYSFKAGKGKKSIERKVKVVPKEKFGENAPNVTVLAYHYVCKDDDKESIKDRYCVTESALNEQMKYLKENDFYFPSFQELRAYVDGRHSLPAKSVIVTFDDGGKDFLENGIPILEKNKIPAVSYVIGVYDGTDKVKTYASRYVAFESHSFDMHGEHVDGKAPIEVMTKDQIVADLKKNTEVVANNDSFAYPYGAYTAEAQEAARQMEIPCTFVFTDGKVHVGDDPTILKRMEIKNKFSKKDFLAALSWK